MNEQAEIKTITNSAERYSCKNQTTTGKDATEIIELSDTKRKIINVAAKIPIAARLAFGASNAKEPSPVATPLPPLNFNQTGNIWPRTANSAAIAAWMAIPV